MKAAVCRAFRAPLVIEDLALAAPGPNDVQVDVKACAICHSDIFYMEGTWGGALPAVYGHEAAGVVRAVGSEITDLQVGDRVICTLIRHCGVCPTCGKGGEVVCEASAQVGPTNVLSDENGGPVAQAMYCGAFAEAVTVHRSQLALMPDEMPFAEASLLACGVLTGVGAVVNTAAVEPGASVVVIGCGGVGLNCIQGARITGAAHIIAVDPQPSKRVVAERLGATATATPEEAARVLSEATGSTGADYVFVSVGVKAAFDSALNLVAPLGAVVLVGMPEGGVMAAYDPGALAAANQRILGSKMGSARIAIDIPKLIELYRTGQLHLSDLISGRYPLEDINEAIARSKSGETLRNVIVFGDA